jgi:hypothetical protein
MVGENVDLAVNAAQAAEERNEQALSDAIAKKR